MKHLLKNARLVKGIKTSELAKMTNIDTALISKFESGIRFPTLQQLEILSATLSIPLIELKTSWIKAKIIHEFGTDEITIIAIKSILSENDSIANSKKENENLDYIFEEIEKIKLKLKNPN